MLQERDITREIMQNFEKKSVIRLLKHASFSYHMHAMGLINKNVKLWSLAPSQKSSINYRCQIVSCYMNSTLSCFIHDNSWSSDFLNYLRNPISEYFNFLHGNTHLIRVEVLYYYLDSYFIEKQLVCKTKERY